MFEGGGGELGVKGWMGGRGGGGRLWVEGWMVG